VEVLLDLAVEKMSFELLNAQAVAFVGPDLRVVDNGVSFSL